MTEETWESKKALPGFVGQEITDKFDCYVFNNDIMMRLLNLIEY